MDLVLLRGPFILFWAIAITCWVASPVVVLVYVLLVFHALRGSRETIEAFTLLGLVLLGHPALFAGGGAQNIRWLILGAGMGRVLWDRFVLKRSMRMPGDVLGVLGIFVASTLVAALTVSRMPSLSIFKLVSFVIGIFAILVAFSNTRHLKQYWRSWMFTFIVFTFLGSVLISVAGLGYYRTSQGFQGIWRHSQLMGPIASMMTAWVLGQYLTKKSRSKFLFVAAVLGPVFIFMSGARTAAVALAGGFIITMLVLAVRKRQGIRWQRFIFNPLTGLATLAFITSMVLFSSQVQQVFIEFVQKDDVELDEGFAVGNASEVFQESRGNLINKSMANFRMSPLLGIGFGVPSYANPDRIEAAYGIPLSASSEKGFTPTAVLEEVGLVGSFLVLLLMITITLPIHRYGELPVIWMYWSALLVNIGAAILFSIGGLGFMLWLVIGYCYSQAVGTERVPGGRMPPPNPRAQQVHPGQARMPRARQEGIRQEGMMPRRGVRRIG